VAKHAGNRSRRSHTRLRRGRGRRAGARNGYRQGPVVGLLIVLAVGLVVSPELP